MRLRKSCDHGKYDAHPVEIGRFAYPDCPGGEYLADDAPIDTWWCLEHEAGQPTNDGPDSFHRCYEWWIGEMDPEAPLLTECRMVEGLVLIDLERAT